MSLETLAIRLVLTVPAAAGNLLLFGLLSALLRLREPRLRAALALILAADVLLGTLGISGIGFVILVLVTDPSTVHEVPGLLAPALLGGMLLGLILITVRRRVGSRRIREGLHALVHLTPAPPSIRAEVAQAARRGGVPPPPVFLSPGDDGPFLVEGVLVLPGSTWAALSVAERAAALDHEMAHVTRRDAVRCAAIRHMTALLWFNPAFGALLRLWGRECEALADRLAIRHGANAGALARSIALLARPGQLRPGPLPALGVETRSSVRRRLGLLERRPRLRGILLQATLILVLLPASRPGLGGCRLVLRSAPPGERGSLHLGLRLGNEAVTRALLQEATTTR